MGTVFVDVDTQLDFLVPAGALYARGAERLVRRIGELNRWAAAHGVPVVSTMDAHEENDAEFRSWPPHCVAGTQGQVKPAETLLEPRVVIPNRPVEVALDGAKQVLLEKQSTDCFTNPNIAHVLARLKADRYVVYGVVTEICVRNAAMGLLRTRKPVVLLTDAIQHLDQAEAEKFFAAFTAQGGQLSLSADSMPI